MKASFHVTTWLSVTITWTFLAVSGHGEIKNGYTDVEGALNSLRGLHSLNLDSGLSPAQRHKIRAMILDVNEYLTYYELTEALLDQFSSIAPELFHQLDTIVDKDGCRTDIYVKFVPVGSHDQLRPAATYISYRGGHTSYSEYGPGTVSIKILTMDGALSMFSHELGHVSYLIPNLATYCKYYEGAYTDKTEFLYLGHRPSDASGRAAAAFEKRFGKLYRDYLSSTVNKPASPWALLRMLRSAGRSV